MSVAPATRRTLTPLSIVTTVALLFALLLLLVRLQWAPLESADHGAADGWWRCLLLISAIVMPVMIAVARSRAATPA